MGFNLIISDVCKNVTNVKMFFGTVENLYTFVSGSSVHAKFTKIQKDMKYKSIIELKRVFLTRWTAQVFACVSLKKVLSPLLILLNNLINKNSDRAAESKELLHLIDFKFIFNLVMLCYILGLFKNTSDYLQNVNAEMAECLSLISSIKTVFQCMRDDDSEINISINELYLEATNISKENNITIPIQNSNKNNRTKKIQENFRQFILTEGSFEKQKLISKSDLKLDLFLPTLDYIINELDKRFTNNTNILSSISYLHPQNENFLNYEQLKPLALHYKIDLEMFLSEIKILPTTILRNMKSKII